MFLLSQNRTYEQIVGKRSMISAEIIITDMNRNSNGEINNREEKKDGNSGQDEITMKIGTTEIIIRIGIESLNSNNNKDNRKPANYKMKPHHKTEKFHLGDR